MTIAESQQPRAQTRRAQEPRRGPEFCIGLLLSVSRTPWKAEFNPDANYSAPANVVLVRTRRGRDIQEINAGKGSSRRVEGDQSDAVDLPTVESLFSLEA
uniref:Uncharacterized protein n=1 Tax=Vespula pensylvanica TaxID=30213 RepID=A0A834UCT0_VESPE|nr:hypothetical protein H0235_004327 [Vespula pensylvanica]